MIKTFNRQQVLYGCLRAALSLFLFAITYTFFHFIASLFVEEFELDVAPKVIISIASACVLGVAATGFFRWKNGQGHFTMAEANIPDNTDTSLLNWHVYQKDLTSNATSVYLLTTLFLAAPIQLLKAYDHFQSLIPQDSALETRMLEFLNQLQAINQWQDFNAHPGWERELIFLIKMGRIQYSAQKGRIKAG